MRHTMKLQDVPFFMMATGRKTIELRLYDEKRQALAIGDEIEFIRTSAPGEGLLRRVVALHRFASFEELYRALPLLRCGYTEETVGTASPHDMAQYYKKKEEIRYGVVGIELETVC